MCGADICMCAYDRIKISFSFLILPPAEFEKGRKIRGKKGEKFGGNFDVTCSDILEYIPEKV